MKKLSVFVLGLIMIATACNCSPTVHVGSRVDVFSLTKNHRRDDNRKRMKYMADRSVEVLWYCAVKPVKKLDKTDKKKTAVVTRLRSRGSGTIVRSTKNRSFIFTAAHVVTEDNKAFKESHNCHASIRRDKLTDSSGKIIKTKILAKVRERDFAVLIVDQDLGVQTALETKPITGEDIWAVGYPSLHLNRNHIALSITKGTLATRFVPYGGSAATHGNFHRVTSQIYFGNSGGGVWTKEGKLLGITVFLFARWGIPYEGSYYIKPVNEVVMHLVKKSMDMQNLKSLFIKDNNYLRPFSG